MYNTMIFRKFTVLCNHDHSPVLEHFYHSTKKLLTHLQSVLIPIPIDLTKENHFDYGCGPLPPGPSLPSGLAFKENRGHGSLCGGICVG